MIKSLSTFFFCCCTSYLSMPFKAGVEGILLSCVGSSGQTRNGSRGHQYPNETLAERSLVYRRIFKCMRKTVLPFNLKVVQILIKSLATFFLPLYHLPLRQLSLMRYFFFMKDCWVYSCILAILVDHSVKGIRTLQCLLKPAWRGSYWAALVRPVKPEMVPVVTSTPMKRLPKGLWYTGEFLNVWEKQFCHSI